MSPRGCVKHRMQSSTARTDCILNTLCECERAGVVRERAGAMMSAVCTRARSARAHTQCGTRARSRTVAHSRRARTVVPHAIASAANVKAAPVPAAW